MHASGDGRPVERVVWRVDTADFLNRGSVARQGEMQGEMQGSSGSASSVGIPELPRNFHIVRLGLGLGLGLGVRVRA